MNHELQFALVKREGGSFFEVGKVIKEYGACGTILQFQDDTRDLFDAADIEYIETIVSPEQINLFRIMDGNPLPL